MARSNALTPAPVGGSALTVLAGDAASFITTATFTTLPWWEKLNAEEQTTVQAEGRLLAQSLLINGASRLAVGEHLTKLQGVLEPHNLFGRFLKNFHFSKRSAYRRITEFRNAKGALPEAILKAASVRGIAIAGETEAKPLGVYTEAVKRLPVPTSADPVQANTWLDQIEQVRKDVRAETTDAAGATGNAFALPVPMDTNTAMKECFRMIENRFNRIPTRQKQAFIKGLNGMILTLAGIGNPQTIAPQAIPEDFHVHRGRPTLQKVANA